MTLPLVVRRSAAPGTVSVTWRPDYSGPRHQKEEEGQQWCVWCLSKDYIRERWQQHRGPSHCGTLANSTDVLSLWAEMEIKEENINDPLQP